MPGDAAVLVLGQQDVARPDVAVREPGLVQRVRRPGRVLERR